MKHALFAVCALLVCKGWGEEAAREVKPLEVVTPDYLYGVINDVDPSPYCREYVPSLFVDSFTKGKSDLFINGKLNRLLVWEKREKKDSGIGRRVVAKRFTVGAANGESSERTVELVLTKASAAVGKRICLLAIGDSITAADLRDKAGNLVGASSWWTFPVEAFSKDNIDRGKDDIRMLAVGTVNVRRGRTFTYRGAEHSMDGCAEGRGSRTTAFYLRHALHWGRDDLPAAWQMLGLAKATGREFQNTLEDRMLIRDTPQGKYPHDYGQALWNRYRSDRVVNRPGEEWANTAPQREAVDKFVAYYEENPENPFFDIKTVKAGNDYGFNLGLYLERYRTLADDGKTRRVVGQTAGTKVADAALFDVCRPTHVAIFLGENDRWHFSGATPEKVTDDMLKIGELCHTFDASIYISFVCHPSLGVWNVNRYEDRVVREKGEGLNAYKFACMTCLKQKLGDRARQEASKTYFSPAFFALDPTSSENAKFAESLDSDAVTPIGGDDSVHPGLDGHRGIGFQVYAWILSTLADGDKR